MDRDEKPVDEHTPLLPDHVAKDVISGWNAELQVKPDAEVAGNMLRKLLAGYPDLNPHDGKGYMATMTNAFMAYPLCVGRSVSTDMPTKHQFHPRLPELIKFLETEQDRIRVIVGRAQKHLIERKKRIEKAAEEATYKATSPERRAALVEIAKATLKPMEGA